MTVAAAASTPFSSTPTKALCSTALTKSGSGAFPPPFGEVGLRGIEAIRHAQLAQYRREIDRAELERELGSDANLG